MFQAESIIQTVGKLKQLMYFSTVKPRNTGIQEDLDLFSNQPEK